MLFLTYYNTLLLSLANKESKISKYIEIYPITILLEFEKVNVPPKLFFLTLFWEFVMFFQLSTSFHYSTAKQFHKGL
jgi:hypothetical protein